MHGQRMDPEGHSQCRRSARGENVARLASALALTGLLSAPACGAADGAPSIGANAEFAAHVLREHTLKTLDGKSFTLGSLRGQVVVVNFWASWCPPCRKELPRLARLESDLSKQGGRVIAISIDSDIEHAQRFCRSRGLGFTIAHDGPDGLARLLDLGHVPLTMVLDRDGSIAYTTEASSDEAIAAVGAAAHGLMAKPLVTSAGEPESR